MKILRNHCPESFIRFSGFVFFKFKVSSVLLVRNKLENARDLIIFLNYIREINIVSILKI